MDSGPEADMVEKAKELCEDLVANVKEQHEEFKNRPPRDDRGGYRGDRDGGDNYRGRGDRGDGRSYGRDSHNGGYGGYGSQGADAATAAAGGANSAELAAQYAQYYQQNPGADPYAAYGGYAA